MRYFDLYHAQLWGHFSKADLGCHWFSPVGSPAASKGPGSDQNFKAWNHFSFPISAFSHPSPAFSPQMMLVEPCKTRDVPCREKKKKPYQIICILYLLAWSLNLIKWVFVTRDKRTLARTLALPLRDHYQQCRYQSRSQRPDGQWFSYPGERGERHALD